MWPVSSLSLRPPHSISTRCMSNMFGLSLLSSLCDRMLSSTICGAFGERVRGASGAPLGWHPAWPGTRQGSSARKRKVLRAPPVRQPKEVTAGRHSAPDAVLLDDRLVALLVLALEVVQQLAALTYHLQKATPGMMIALVLLEVVLELVDPGGEEGDLHFRRAGVAGGARIVRDDRFLIDWRHRHVLSVSLMLGARRPRNGRGRDVVQPGREGIGSHS